MPISENVGGVLRTHSAEREVIDGVTVEKNSVVVDDGGVMREIFRANKGATVEGITPLVVAEDHIVIVESGTFTLSAPAGARIIVGGAAKYNIGGKVAEYTLESAIKNAQCTSQCGAVNSGEATSLTIGDITYDSGATKQIIQSKWGPIGGEGGQGATYIYESTVTKSNGKSGTGAGGGGGGTGSATYGGFGGNIGNYGNCGGSGGGLSPSSSFNGNPGQSGKGGTGATAAGGGGGGGYSAAGGYGAYCRSGEWSSGNQGTRGNPGEGGAGIIVIEW